MLFARNFLANVLENESCSKHRELIQNLTFLSMGLNGVFPRRRSRVHPLRDVVEPSWLTEPQWTTIDCCSNENGIIAHEDADRPGVVLTYCRCLIHQQFVGTGRSFCSLYCRGQREGERKRWTNKKEKNTRHPADARQYSMSPLGGRSVCTGALTVQWWGASMQLDKRLHQHHQRGGALPPPPPPLLLHARLAGGKTWRGLYWANDWHGWESGIGSFAYPFTSLLSPWLKKRESISLSINPDPMMGKRNEWIDWIKKRVQNGITFRVIQTFSWAHWVGDETQWKVPSVSGTALD